MSASYAGAFKAVFLAVFIFVDLILFLVPFLMTRSRNRKLREYTITAEATVIDMSREHNKAYHGGGHNSGRHNNNAPMWYPTYQYAVGGQVFTHKSHVGTSAKPYEVGDKLKILVDPNNYEKYIIPDSKGFKLATGILWALFAFFLIGIVCAALFM